MLYVIVKIETQTENAWKRDAGQSSLNQMRLKDILYRRGETDETESGSFCHES